MELGFEHPNTSQRALKTNAATTKVNFYAFLVSICRHFVVSILLLTPCWLWFWKPDIICNFTNKNKEVKYRNFFDSFLAARWLLRTMMWRQTKKKNERHQVGNCIRFQGARNRPESYCLLFLWIKVCLLFDVDEEISLANTCQLCVFRLYHEERHEILATPTSEFHDIFDKMASKLVKFQFQFQGELTKNRAALQAETGSARTQTFTFGLLLHYYFI